MQVATMSSDTDMVVKRLSVPMGLEELMESLTKEVLRRKPSDIYAFASEHFAQLLEIRDQGNMRGSLRRLKKAYSQASYDTSESVTNKNNPIKVKSATFGSMAKDRAANISKSPVSKSMLTKKNAPMKDVSPGVLNPSGKTGKQDRNKSIMEKRRAGKRNMEEAKMKLESLGQPVELESKKFGKTARKSDVTRRRHSVVQRKDDKEVVEKVRSRSSSKGKLDDISKPTAERTRRKSNASKSIKKAEEHDKTKLSANVAHELKASKVTPTVEKISPRTRDGKRRMSKDLQKAKSPLPEMSETIVSAERHQILTTEPPYEAVPGSFKQEEPVLTKVTEISDDIITQMGQESGKIEESNLMDSTENVEALIEKDTEASNIVVTQVELQTSEADKPSVAPDMSKSEELELVKEDVVTREESFPENVLPNQHNQEVNFQKSNSESLNIDSEDTDKISESKIDLILKNIEDTEELAPQLAELSISTKEVDDKENKEKLENKEIEISRDSFVVDQECGDDTIVKPHEVQDNAVTVIEETENNKTDIVLNENDTKEQVNELEKAAVKIQSLIRGNLIRKMMSKNVKSCNVDESVASIKDTGVEIIPNENVGETISQVDKINEKIDIDNKISKNENFSFENIIDDVGVVIKIQALVRGYLARKFLNKKNVQQEATCSVNDGVQNFEIEVMGKDEITQAENQDIKQVINSNILNEEVTEPEFRIPTADGQLKPQELQETNSQADEFSSDLLHNIDAIIKIQSVVRGYLTRKSILKTSSAIPDSSSGYTQSEQKQNEIPKRTNENSIQQKAPSSVIDEVSRSIGDGLVENKFDSKDFMKINPSKEQTSDFLGYEFIHYDSSRYDDPIKASNKEPSETVKDVLNIKQNDEEIEVNLKQGADRISEVEIEEKVIKFNSNEAFGDDVKPTANSVEKLADIPNCADDAATKIQSTWRGHRMRRAVRSMKFEDLQKPPECDELPHQRSSPEDAKKAAIIIQALFRGYMTRKRYESADRRPLKKRNFEGSLPTLMEVEGEDNKYSTSSSDHEKIEEMSNATSNLEERSQTPLDKSESSAAEGRRTISDEEVFAMLKQLDDTAIPTEQPRRKSKIYTRSLTFDDPLTQHTTVNLLTKSMTFVMGDEFQRFDANDSLRSVGTDQESLSTESETKLLEETNDISEITSAIKQDVQKLKKTLEDGVEIEEVSDDKKQDNRNIAEITKSICEDVVQLEKTLSDDTESIALSIVDNSNPKIENVVEPSDASTRPVSKDSVTSTDSVDTVIFNDIYRRDILNQTSLKEDVLANIAVENLPTEITEEPLHPVNTTDLQRLDAVFREGDTLVTDILNTAKNRLQNEDINNQFFEQDPIPQIVSDKRQSTTSDELRQLWHDEAATTIQKNYRGYRARRDLETQPYHTEEDSKKATEDSVNKEITRYLNQITAPLRRAFSADKSLEAIEDKENSSKKRVHSASLETPSYVYIPLRDYSDEVKDAHEQISEIIISDNLGVLNIDELNNNNQVVKNEEMTKKELSISDMKAETVTNNDASDNVVKVQPTAIEDNGANTESKIEEVDREASQKISACISAVVAPITKRFQPAEGTDGKDTSEIVTASVETEPVYQYIPLRNYSQEESKENESVPVRCANIAASESKLKEELNVSKNVEVTNDIAEVHKQSENILSENILSESISETIHGETDKLSNNLNDSLDKNLTFLETDVGVNQVKETVALSSQHKGEYASKEINEYIDSIVDPIKKTFSPYKIEPPLVTDAQPALHQFEPVYIPLKDYSTEETVKAEHTTESGNDQEFKDATETIVITAKSGTTGGTTNASEETTKSDENKTLEVVQELEVTDNSLQNLQTQQRETVSESLIKNENEELDLQDNGGKRILDLESNSTADVNVKVNTMLSLNEEFNEGKSNNLEGNQEEGHVNCHQTVQTLEANEGKSSITEKVVIEEHITDNGNDAEFRDTIETTMTTAKDSVTEVIISESEENAKEDENKTLEVVKNSSTDNGLPNFQTQQMEIASGNLMWNEDEKLDLQNSIRKGISEVEVSVNKTLSLNEELNEGKSNNLGSNQEEAYNNSHQTMQELEINEEKTPITGDTVKAEHTIEVDNDQELKDTTETTMPASKNATIECITSASEEGTKGDENKTSEVLQELELIDNNLQKFQIQEIEIASGNLLQNKDEGLHLQDNVEKGILNLESNLKEEVNVNVNKMSSLNEELDEGKSTNQEEAHQIVKKLEPNKEKACIAGEIVKTEDDNDQEFKDTIETMPSSKNATVGGVIEEPTLQKVDEQLTNPPDYSHSDDRDKPDVTDSDANGTHIESINAEGAHSVNLDITPIESIPQDIETEETKLSSDNAIVIKEIKKEEHIENKQELINETAEVIKNETSPLQIANEIIKSDLPHDITETYANKDALIDEKVQNNSNIELKLADVIQSLSTSSTVNNLVTNVNNLDDTSEIEKSELIDQIIESNEPIKEPNDINLDYDKNDNKFSFVADNLMQDNALQLVVEPLQNFPKVVGEIETSQQTPLEKVTAKTDSEKTVEETTDTSDQISDIVTEINDTTIDSQAENPVNEVMKSVDGTDPSSTARTTSSDILTTQENEATGVAMERKYVEVQKVDEDIKEQLSSSNGDSRSSSLDIIRIEIKDKSPIENLVQQEKVNDQRLVVDDTSLIDNSMSAGKIEKSDVNDVSVDVDMRMSTNTSEISNKHANNILNDSHKKSDNDTRHLADVIANKEDEREIEHGKEENKELEGKMQTDQVVEEIVSKEDIRNSEMFNNKETIATVEENLPSGNEQAASSTTDQTDAIPNEEREKVLENSNVDDEFQAQIENIESEIETVLGKISSIADNAEDAKSEIAGQTEIDGKEAGVINTTVPGLSSDNSLEKHADKVDDVSIPGEKQISDDKPKMDSDNISSENGVQSIKIEKADDMERSMNDCQENMEENILPNTTIAPVSSCANEEEIVSDGKTQNNNIEKQILDVNGRNTIHDAENRSEAAITANATDINVEEHEQDDTFTNKRDADLSNDIKDDIQRSHDNTESNILNTAVTESNKQISDQNQRSSNIEGSNDMNKLSEKINDIITTVDISQHEGGNQKDTGTHGEDTQIVDSGNGTDQAIVGNENTESKATNVSKTQEQECRDVIDNGEQQYLNDHIINKEYTKEDIAGLHEDTPNDLTEQDQTDQNNRIDHSCDDKNVLNKVNIDEVSSEINASGDVEDNIVTGAKREVQEVSPEALSMKQVVSKLLEDTTQGKYIYHTDDDLISQPQKQQDISNTQLASGLENIQKIVEEMNVEDPVSLVENNIEKETTEEDKGIEIINADLGSSEDAKKLKEEDKIHDKVIENIKTNEKTEGQTIDSNETALVYENIVNDKHENQQNQHDEELQQISEVRLDEDSTHDTLQDHGSTTLEQEVNNDRIQEELKEDKLQEDHENNKFDEVVKDDNLQVNNEENKLGDIKDSKLQENHKETKMEDDLKGDTMQDHQDNKLEENNKIQQLQENLSDNTLEQNHQNEKLLQNHKDDELKNDHKDIEEYHAPSAGFVSESAKHVEAEGSKEGKTELTDFKQLSMRDVQKDNIIFPKKEVEHDLPDHKPEQILTSMQEESSKDAVALNAESQIIKNKIKNEDIVKASSKENEIDELLNKQHGSPFYLHQDLYIPEAPSTFQEKKFAEALKLSTDTAKEEEDNVKAKEERLLHSGEFHDSIPINIASEPANGPVTTQTNGIQCNIEHERSIPASTVLVHSGELHDNILPLALQMNQDPGQVFVIIVSGIH